MTDNLKIGVFLCECGGNISDIVDLDEVRKALNVEVIEQFENLCSLNGRKLIRDAIIERHLDRVVVAACSPISHERTFQDYVKPLNPYLMDMANIREQCSWVHDDKEKATKKAITLIKASIEKVKQSDEVNPIYCPIPEDVAVIGGGIAGMNAALSLAKQGKKVTIIEQSPSLGGYMAKIGKVFSPVKIAEECGMCLLNPILNDLVWNDNITVLTNSKVVEADRHAGTYNLIVEKSPRFVDPDKCIACGKCVDVCDIEVPDDWNEGLSKRKAIYRPFGQSYPEAYVIDPDACTKCGDCKRQCMMDAITLKQKPVKFPLQVGSIIVATGHQLINPDKRPDYSYSRHPDIITQMELGRITGVNGPTKGELLKSNGEVPKRVVMIQCVGSRDEKPDGHRYCSKICCSVASKNANIIKHKYPDTDVVVCYTDVRTPGMFEKYYKHTQENGVRFLRGRPGEVAVKGDDLIVRVENTIKGEFEEIEADMVVLSTAMEPSEGTKEIAEILNIGTTEDHFIKESHPKIKPVTTDVQGVFVCGTAQDPKDITDSIMQATSAASKVAEYNYGGVEIEPFIADIDPEKCQLCGDCLEKCKFKALSIVDAYVVLDPMSCDGCGKCLTVCQHGAININGNIDEKISATIDGILSEKQEGERTILVFLDTIGYTAADNIGVNRISYPESIHIIKVHSVNRIRPNHIKHALENGADGVFIGEFPGDLMYEEVERKIQRVREEISDFGENPERLAFSKVYIPYFEGLARKLNDFDDKIAQLDGTEN
ncbi:MAG: FAD-dependent oxidoreductase [Methanobrevibacter sp.]|uniref:ferredoxin:CoB-CoM heterodisulfide reductase subunit HdrA n=1 Tax=Methanobrevibacter sp. TaxID=66852 RepID=UPI0025F084A1|nr:ferredoxin:CoB-CoM heterodisulfide reductase subunit HdrA [Methanobrevibacter sp.]MBQ8017254.1 FAD-dependent oxidoreductase [Methanobrevibacter sp.]